jgi:hypothetical protein
VISLPRVLEAGGEVQAFCESQGWRFCFIGGVAVQRWGNPRVTQDVDLTLLTGFGNEEAFLQPLLRRFAPRRPDALEFALSRRVLLVRTESGVDADIALGAMPFEEGTVARASSWGWAPERFLITCTAEDLLVHKVFAGRDRDWGDVEGILARQHGKLDFSHVYAELAPLLELKEDPDALPKLERMLATVERRLRLM